MGSQPSLRTERLVLRPLLLSDAARVRILCDDAELSMFLPNMPNPYPRRLAESWIASHRDAWQKGRQAVFAVVEATSRDLVGTVALVIQRQSRVAELGYWLGRQYWGRGYAAEAVQAVIDFGFGPLSLHRVYAHCLTGNVRSLAVLSRVGMVHEGYRRQHVLHRDAWHDVEEFGLLASEHKLNRGDAAPRPRSR